jgi:regulator of RNase E activity RraA
VSRCRIFPPSARPSPEALAQLRKMPTTIVSDQLDRLGVVRGIVRMTGEDLGVLAGAAFTVRTRPGDNLVVYKAVELAEPGDVLVVEAGGLEDRAVIGEIFYRHMVAKGIGGVVIDGMIRDATEIAAGPVPVFARGATHPGPYKTGPGELRGPVSVGGTIVRNGDAIVGDGDGIAVVPLERVQEVVEGGLALLAKEEKALAQADAGELDVSWVDDALDIEWVGNQP